MSIVIKLLKGENKTRSFATIAVRPLDVMIEGDRQPLSAHKTVELVCRATGSRPPAIITWWKGTSKLKALKDNISVDGNVTTSIITMTPSSDDNGKHLSCRAENPLISGSAIEYGWKLEVHYIPQLTLRLGSKLRHSHIQEGNDVYLDCSIIASPWVSEIGWRFGGKELVTNTSAGIIVSNQSLVLQKVQRTSRGYYTCVASNSEGEGESNNVQLRVQYSPLCKPGQKVIYGAARHEAVKVVCEVEADPKQLSFRWEFNSSSDNMQVLTFVTDNLRSVATYIPRTEQDYGTLLCWAENSVGRQKEPCVYLVVPAGPPESVQNCIVNNQTEQSFRVECTEGYDGGMTQHYVLEVHDVLLNALHSNQTSHEPVFTVKGLTPGTEFLVVVYAVNSKGRSEAIALRTSTLTTPESLTRVDDVWQVSFNPVLVVLVAIVIGLVLLALIIVLVVKFRSRHHHRKTNQDCSKDDKCQTPLRKDTDDDWKSCSCAGEEKCPDIIPGPLKEGTMDEDDDLCGDGLHWRTSSVDGVPGILSPDSYSRSKLSASGVPLLQSTSPTPPLSQELSLQPTLLQEYSPPKVLSRAAKQVLGDSYTELTTTSRQTKV
ncbi:neural cell adhesion molecule 1-A-like [Uloborus diversus]|uniref:neural cell adhesion molecule 1-A-like n=1 Tax=Uloborus diversus TaxID=327109 RepID=UPI0024094DF6|nr:neural cell adhesion molecule 1-A-like [Uloborus diversus]